MDAAKDDEQNREDAESEEANKNQFTKECLKMMKPAIDEMVRARRAHKDSQEDIADKLGVTVDYIGKIEQNRSKLPAYVMQKYCQEYNLSADELFGMSRGEDSLDVKDIKIAINRVPEPYLTAIMDIVNLYYRNIAYEPKK